MSKGLERDLGLYSVVTVSIGAMIGSGIFVLPGIASTMAGPSVVLAYLLAGILVVPAALSKAEMATAMPESGGTYLYIERSVGPLMGTIAGIGVWFSLTFKSAFALVGLGAYLVFFTAFSAKVVGLFLATILIAVNILGVKQSGRLQVVVVTLSMAVLVGFVGDGLTYVQGTNLHPFLPHGAGGLLAATGFVYVSYAGVTKIASIAEEIENPGRNIPLGILLSVGVMMLVYTLVVLVIVGVTSPDELGKTLTPMAAAARQFLGGTGEIVIAATAVIALVSMANAGLLSSSRYPFAMSRDRLAPDVLGEINSRFRTPVWAILLTGAFLAALIAFVPVTELAKLASAFKLLVFTLINVALIVFRESDDPGYVPEFVAPGYPWVQLFGIVGCLLLLTQMGLLALAGAVGIVVAGSGWYWLYARDRIDREGAASGTMRQATDRYSLESTRSVLQAPGWDRVLVAMSPWIEPRDEANLVRIAGRLLSRGTGRIEAARFEEVPDQITLHAAAEKMTTDDIHFEDRMRELSEELDVPLEWGEIVSHDARRAIVNLAARRGSGLLVAEWRSGHRRWLMSHSPCDLLFVRNRSRRHPEEPTRIAVVADRGPYDPLEIAVARGLASSSEGTNNVRVEFLYAVDGSAAEARIESIGTYHDELRELFPVAAASRVLQSDDRAADLLAVLDGFDLVIMSESSHHFLYDVVFGDLPDEVADRADCTVILVHSRKPLRHTFLRWVVEKVAY